MWMWPSIRATKWSLYCSLLTFVESTTLHSSFHLPKILYVSFRLLLFSFQINYWQGRKKGDKTEKCSVGNFNLISFVADVEIDKTR